MGKEPKDSPRRRRFHRAFAEMHFQLRTEGGTPANNAGSVALGVFIGSLPIYGLHLVLCVAFARLLRLSRVRTYLAAHVNNPFTAPLLVTAQLAVGHRLLDGDWPTFDLRALPSVGRLGAHLVVGSLVVGVVLAVLLSLLALAISSRWSRPNPSQRLIERTAKRYLASGVFDWEFVLGKLRWDPLYLGLLESGLLPPKGLLLDLGCGRGILAALVATAAERKPESPGSEGWPAGWPEPPRELEILGFERSARKIAAARVALGPEARLETGDLTTTPLPPAEGVVLLDVLHYLPRNEQEALLGRVAQALRPSGLLLLREADAAGGLAFFWTRVGERLAAWSRGHFRQRFAYRSAEEWRSCLEGIGLRVTDEHPMSAGTPYSNVLLGARRPVEGSNRSQTGPRD
ncbi:MAG: DUF2062 domain-containing protein [Acidobacteriota bacterium]